MHELELAGTENADLRPIQELMGKCKRLVTFVNSRMKTQKIFFEAGKQQSETFTTLKQEVATRLISSYVMLESILNNQKILQRVFLDNSFEENRQSLLPMVSEFCSILLLCSLLAALPNATNLLEGEIYITTSLGHAVVRQLRSELLADGYEIWRDGNPVERLRWAEVYEQFDTSGPCHFSLLVLAIHARFITHLSLLTLLLHCLHSMSQAPNLPCTSLHHSLEACC